LIETPRILVLFGKKASMNAWTTVLALIRNQAIVIVGQECEAAATLDFVPKIALISIDLYPYPQNELAKKLSGAYPDITIIVLADSCASHVPLRNLQDDNVCHLVVPDSAERTSRVLALIRAINDGQNWDFMSYLQHGAKCREFYLTEVAEKEALLSQIENMIVGDAQDLQILRQSAVLLADEMIENAFQVAPQNEKSVVKVKAGFDGDSLALQVVDFWGTLTPEKALEYLTNHQEEQVPLDCPRGRGLLILWQFFDHFHINIKPGKETAIGGKLHRKSQLRFNSCLKGFDFFQLSFSSQ